MKRFFYTLLTAILLMPLSVCAEDAYELTNINPADGSVLTGFSKDDAITFTTSFDTSCGGFNVSVVDNEKGVTLYDDFTSEKNEDGQWVLSFYDDVKFQKGHTYTIEIVGHEKTSPRSDVVGKVSASYVGDGEEYDYSEVSLVSISPKDGSELKDISLNFAIVDYSGEVQIDASRSVVIDEDGNAVPFQQIISVKNAGMSWQLIIPTNVLQNCTSTITLQIYAKDKGGLVVKGNKGVDEDSYYEVTYSCTIGYPEINVYPTRGKIRSIKEFVFSSDETVGIKDGDKSIVLYKQDKSTVVSSFKGSDLSAHESDPLALIYRLENEITAQGTYYLYVPMGVFGLGKNSLDNKEQWVEYSIVDKMEEYGVTLSPADGSTVNSLSNIYITFNNWNAAIPYYNNSQKITVTNSSGAVVTEATATIDANRTKVNQCIIKLKNTITAPGTYYLNIPDYAFILDVTGNYHSSPMSFEFTVEAGADPALDVTVTATANSSKALSRIDLNFNGYSFVAVANADQEVELTNAAGNVVAKGILKNAVAKTALYVEIEEGYNVTATGDYTLTIPAGYIKLISTPNAKDLKFTVTFDATTAIQSLDSEESETVKVYNLQGVLIRESQANEALDGLKGLFIVNGKKIYVK